MLLWADLETCEQVFNWVNVSNRRYWNVLLTANVDFIITQICGGGQQDEWGERLIGLPVVQGHSWRQRDTHNRITRAEEVAHDMSWRYITHIHETYMKHTWNMFGPTKKETKLQKLAFKQSLCSGFMDYPKAASESDSVCSVWTRPSFLWLTSHLQTCLAPCCELGFGSSQFSR